MMSANKETGCDSWNKWNNTVQKKSVKHKEMITQQRRKQKHYIDMYNFENGMYISDDIRTATMQPCTLEYVLQSISGCLSHRGKKQTDQSNASNTVTSLSMEKVIDQLHASTYLKEFLH